MRRNQTAILLVILVLLLVAVGVVLLSAPRPQPELAFQFALRNGETSTPTATATSTITLTPSRTLTPRPTATSGTPIATRTHTPTPNWVVQNCPAITPVMDGSLSEWSAVTPVALSASTGTLQQFVTTATPTTADISGSFYCGYAGSTVYFAGTVLDDSKSLGVTHWDEGSIGRGDSVRVVVDGLRDGLRNPGVDDRDLFLGSYARMLDFDVYPVDTESDAGSITGGWAWEFGIDKADLGLTALNVGTKFGVIWELRDVDGSPGVMQSILTSDKRMATIQ